MAKNKIYDINFTLAETAMFTVSATSKKAAKEYAEDYLANGMSDFELIDRLKNAISYGGLKVTAVSYVEDDEDDYEVSMSVESSDGRITVCEVLGYDLAGLKTSALKNVEEQLKRKCIKAGDVHIAMSISKNNGKWIDSDEDSAYWDGEKILLYEEQ